MSLKTFIFPNTNIDRVLSCQLTGKIMFKSNWTNMQQNEIKGNERNPKDADILSFPRATEKKKGKKKYIYIYTHIYRDRC